MYYKNIYYQYQQTLVPGLIYFTDLEVLVAKLGYCAKHNQRLLWMWFKIECLQLINCTILEDLPEIICSKY